MSRSRRRNNERVLKRMKNKDDAMFVTGPQPAEEQLTPESPKPRHLRLVKPDEEVFDGKNN